MENFMTNQNWAKNVNSFCDKFIMAMPMLTTCNSCASAVVTVSFVCKYFSEAECYNSIRGKWGGGGLFVFHSLRAEIVVRLFLGIEVIKRSQKLSAKVREYYSVEVLYK